MYLTDDVRLPRFCFTRGGFARFPALTRCLGTRFAVIGGHTAMQKALPLLEDALTGTDMQLLGAFEYGGECTLRNISRAAENAAPLRPDFLVGMGGGKAIDTAKGAAHKLGLPLVTLPTLVSNCAPVTSLSVVYSEGGPFDHFLFYDAPPELTLIDLTLAAEAPSSYFRAGMGDALAKYPESSFSARNDTVGVNMDHMSLLGVTLGRTCWEPILRCGREALSEVERHEAGNAMELCARSIIISAGLVSLLAHDDYNCALAHAVCYGLQHFPHVERDFLHGDLVAYGALVQLTMDGQTDAAKELRAFLVSLGTPVTLRQLGVPLDRSALEDSLTEAVEGPDMAHIAYPVTRDMVFDAMRRVEAMA